MINRTLQRIQFNRRMRARIRILAAALFAGVLTACGGGDPEDDPCVQNSSQPGDAGREQASWVQICR